MPVFFACFERITVRVLWNIIPHHRLLKMFHPDPGSCCFSWLKNGLNNHVPG